MKTKRKMILLCGGGHARVLIGLIRAAGEYDLAGILDPGLEKGSSALGVTVSGDDSLLAFFYGSGVRDACIGLGSVRAGAGRRALFDKVKGEGFRVPPLRHPSAIVTEGVEVGEGVQVMAGAVLQVKASVGENSIINTGALIEHDTIIGMDAHIGPGAVVCGGCAIGHGTNVGAGATVMQGIGIGKNCIVAAGAVVVKNVPDGATVKGVPAR